MDKSGEADATDSLMILKYVVEVITSFDSCDFRKANLPDAEDHTG